MISSEILLGYLGDLQFEDDLNIILQWLLPNEHQCHPPSLRVRTSIKTVLSQDNNTFLEGLRFYYYDLVRGQYMTKLEEKGLTYGQLVKLEKKLYYPLQFIPILSGSQGENMLDQTMYAIRHYLIDTNKQFRNHLKDRIQILIREEDFDICQNLIQWIHDSHCKEFNSKGFILDILLEKINETCHKEMTGIWQYSDVVDRTYGSFMSKYWKGFAQLLSVSLVGTGNSDDENDSDDDNEIKRLIRDHFEKQFISIRISEILPIISHCKRTGPTILELRSLMQRHNFIEKLTNTILSQYQKLIIEKLPSTSDILVIFIRCMDILLFLQVRDYYLRLLTTFLKPYMISTSRKDFIPCYLYAVLGLTTKEFQDYQIYTPDGINHLKRALRGSHLIAFYSGILSSQKNTGSDVGNETTEERNPRPSLPFFSHDNNRMIVADLLRQYNKWIPDGMDEDSNEELRMKSTSSNFTGMITGRSNFLTDCILTLLDDKDELVSLLLNIITLRLIHTPTRRLDDKTLIAYRRIYQRIRYGHNLLLWSVPTGNISKRSPTGENLDNIDSELFIEDERTRMYNDRIVSATSMDEEDEIFIQFNKIDVMLGDMLESNELEKYIVPIKEFPRVCPKFVSSFCWSLKKATHRDHLLGVENHIKISPQLDTLIMSYIKGYRRLKPGRVIRFYKDETIVSVTLTTNAGESIDYVVSMSQFSIIEKFGGDIEQLSMGELVNQCGMTSDEVQSAIRYWIDHGVLIFDGDTYRTTDLLE